MPLSHNGRAAAVQWLSELQAVRQAVPFALQMRSPHDAFTAAGQLPAPSQPARAVNVRLVLRGADRHQLATEHDQLGGTPPQALPPGSSQRMIVPPPAAPQR